MFSRILFLVGMLLALNAMWHGDPDLTGINAIVRAIVVMLSAIGLEIFGWKK